MERLEKCILWSIPCMFLVWPFIIYDMSEMTETGRESIRVIQVMQNDEGPTTQFYRANGEWDQCHGAFPHARSLVWYRGRLGGSHRTLR